MWDGSIGKPAVPALVAGLEGPHASDAARALGRVGTAAVDAIAPLLAMLRGGNESVRADAAEDRHAARVRELAELLDLGVDLGEITTVRNLQDGLMECLRRQAQHKSSRRGASLAATSSAA